MTITTEQVREARRLLGWSVSALADRSQLSQGTITNFENGVHPISGLNVAAIRLALEAAGVEFTYVEQPSVKLKESHVSEATRPHWLSELPLLIFALIGIWVLILMLWAAHIASARAL